MARMKLLARMLNRSLVEDATDAEEKSASHGSVITFDNQYASQLYSRGYIARGITPPRAPADWRRLVFANLYVAHDPRLNMRVSTAGRAKLLCLGLLFDVRDPLLSTESCQQNLVERLRKGEIHFLVELAHMCGRFVCLYVDGRSRTFVVTDATGMKSAFYRPDGPACISSHVELLARNEPTMPARSDLPFRYGYPGLRTTREGIRLLTPNSRLDIASGTPARFWPVRHLVERDLDQASELFSTNFNNAMTYVARNHEPIISVTAGLDSRTTFSASLKYENVCYFTYFTNKSSPSMQRDRAFNATLTADAILRAELLTTSESDRDFFALVSENTVGHHSQKLALQYYTRFANVPNALHVRSNIAEVGREFWRALPFPVVSPTDLAKIYLNGTDTMRVPDVFRTIAHFTEFDAVTGLLACARLVDVKSLFYWEFRMASWHSQVVTESDPAFDSVSLFNCRSTLETMLSVQRQYRTGGELQKRLIRANNPALAAYPINGKPFNYA